MREQKYVKEFKKRTAKLVESANAYQDFIINNKIITTKNMTRYRELKSNAKKANQNWFDFIKIKSYTKKTK